MVQFTHDFGLCVIQFTQDFGLYVVQFTQDFGLYVVQLAIIIDLYVVHGVYISQLIHYSRDCGSYQDFLGRGLLLTRKLLNQRSMVVELK